jgi:poly-gamma-glutamate synthesis protein (capsule biosynthesis protein)
MQRAFAHRLIDGGFNIVHGHSSHHAKGVEIYSRGLILYGCGDFISDYEGISGYEEFRDDLTIIYTPRVDGTDGHLVSLAMVPMQIRKFRLNRASRRDTIWLYQTVVRESAKLDTKIMMRADDSFGIEAMPT